MAVAAGGRGAVGLRDDVLSESEGPGCEKAAEAALLRRALRRESSVVALCTGEQCGVYRCRGGDGGSSAGKGGAHPGRDGGVAQPAGGSPAQLGQRAGAAGDTRPVFIIPWRHKPPLLPSQQQMLDEAAKERAKPHEQHHIFPQAFKLWFTGNGIDIDEYVILLEVEKHRSIHRGAKGGPWNAAWGKFIKRNRQGRGDSRDPPVRGSAHLRVRAVRPSACRITRQPPPAASGVLSNHALLLVA